MPDTETYFVILANCLKELNDKYDEELTSTNFLFDLIEKCVVYSDYEDPNNT